MDTGGFSNPKVGSDSQNSNDLLQPGTSDCERLIIPFPAINAKLGKNVSTSKGVEQAKKRLRAFSIQKKSALSPVSVPKHIGSGNATVFIGKAARVKTAPKPEPDPTAEPKKPPKPPKPGTRLPQESYISTQKKTLAEIEDMKRKMELVELGIPLGLICPAPNSDKAMPTKAMPPIKTFLDSDKVDEVIREAKQAKAEGKEFKFDYRKLLPDYANPFQRKKDTEAKEFPESAKLDEQDHKKSRERDKRRSDKLNDAKRHSYRSDKDRHRDDKYKGKSNERDENIKEGEKSRDPDSKYKHESKYRDKDEKSNDKEVKSKERDNRSKEKDSRRDVKKHSTKTEKEAEVNLKDFVVCDSWSDNEDKSKDSTPINEEVKKHIEEKIFEKTPVSVVDPIDQLRESLSKKEKPDKTPKPKLNRLNPVMDSFKFEIVEPDEEDIIDMFNENTSKDKSTGKCKAEYESHDMQIFDYDNAKEATFEGMADDTFLESIINEIKQEEMDETSQDKGLVEYDESPSKDGDARDSVTPEIDDKVRQIHSSRSDYSDGYKSTESGYKSIDSLKLSDYKCNVELERTVEDRKRELEKLVVERNVDKYTANSLETWSFVLKICQPLLFRHDRNKCYKETRAAPKLWYTENPKMCGCVKDRRVVYQELEMCKMGLVGSLYSGTQAEQCEAGARAWYPRAQQWPPSGVVPAASEWEAEDSQPGPAATPEPSGDISLDKEYQRFMEAVWPEVSDPASETPRSTPLRHKKKADDELALKLPKKPRVSSEGWSQESDVDEEPDKSVTNKAKAEKEKLEKRKRKHSTSTSTDSSESDAKKRKKTHKKKVGKKTKFKEAKRRRVARKNVKKLKDKQKKKKKALDMEEDSDLQELEKDKKKKDKRLKKKKQLKRKKKNQKKKKSKPRSSSSSDSSSDSEPERKSKNKKKNSGKKKKHKTSQEELFDVNILKNIKTERETDDEISKQMEFSPRRQKPREIINVKELQNDFVGNSIQIKKEVEEEHKVEREEAEKLVEKQESQDSTETVPVQVSLEIKNFQEQEKIQSTLQPPPDESNHSQASSQESTESVKDQPIYEKDESHLRPSSQNSNYNFHDVMASGMLSKNMEHSTQQTIVHEIQSHELDVNRHVDDANRHEHDGKRHEIEIQSHEHDINRREQDIQRHEQEVQRQHEMRSCDHDVKSRKRDRQILEHDLSHEHKIQSQEQDTHVLEQDIKRHSLDLQSHENDMRRHEQNVQSREHEIQSSHLEIQSHAHVMQSHGHEIQEHELDNQYEQGNYEIYEQMAMAYQNDVASQHTSPPDGSGERRIETVVRVRTCGEIKCDWRAEDGVPSSTPARPSRWGLKPGEVNIVLTGGEEALRPARPPRPAVYRIQSLANRSDGTSGYDEAYLDMYGAADKLQYGDCFSEEHGAGAGEPDPARAPVAHAAGSLDARINLALRTTVLGEVANELASEDKDAPERGILVTKSLSVCEGRGGKRVSFADGYKPGQDSDVEEPPAKKRRKARRAGCAWPCPAAHADHVPLWDALPPPPPPPGSPPPVAPRAPPAHLLRQGRTAPRGMQSLLPPPHLAAKFDVNSMSAFMPPEPPPGLISFPNM